VDEANRWVVKDSGDYRLRDAKGDGLDGEDDNMLQELGEWARIKRPSEGKLPASGCVTSDAAAYFATEGASGPMGEVRVLGRVRVVLGQRFRWRLLLRRVGVANAVINSIPKPATPKGYDKGLSTPVIIRRNRLMLSRLLVVPSSCRYDLQRREQESAGECLENPHSKKEIRNCMGKSARVRWQIPVGEIRP
jgi:hypothetical protein